MPRFKIAPQIIEAADGEVDWVQEEDTPPPTPSPSPEPIPEAVLKKERRKKKLSEAQLAALEKGRARVAENKRMRDLKKKRDELISRKEEKEFVDAGIKNKKSAKATKAEIKKSNRETKIREKLLEKKKLKELRETKKANWELMREETLDKCETIEDFDELTKHLDSVEDEDMFDDEKLKTKLNKIYDMYKYEPQAEQAKAEQSSEGFAE
tara:strand:+ start:758 stop:1387 length:630 start_codon:yes stop_codon:yes gene_type:complete